MVSELRTHIARWRACKWSLIYFASIKLSFNSLPNMNPHAVISALVVTLFLGNELFIAVCQQPVLHRTSSSTKNHRRANGDANDGYFYSHQSRNVVPFLFHKKVIYRYEIATKHG